MLDMRLRCAKLGPLSVPLTTFVISENSRFHSNRLGSGKAGIAQPVEHKLPKLGVAGSKPVARSMNERSGSIPFLRLSAFVRRG